MECVTKKGPWRHIVSIGMKNNILLTETARVIFQVIHDGYFVTHQKLWKYRGKKNVVSKTISKQLIWTLSFFRSIREWGFSGIKVTSNTSFKIMCFRNKLHWFTLVFLHEHNHNFLKAQSLLITKWFKKIFPRVQFLREGENCVFLV